MLREFFAELIRGRPVLPTELLDLKKNSLQNFLGMFKVLQFLGFWVYRKMLRAIIVELVRGVGGPELSTEFLDLKKNSLQIFWVFEVLQFLGFWVYRILLREFFAELIRGGPELSSELVELPTKNTANFCNFKNHVSLRVMIFAELYLRRTLELFFS